VVDLTGGGTMRHLLQTLLDAWREAGRRLEIGEAAARVTPLLARRLPLGLLLVRGFDLARGGVETVAPSAPHGAAGAAAAPADAAPLDALFAWCRRGRVLHRGASAVARQLPGALPAGVDGDVLLGPLRDGEDAIGLLVLVSRRPQRFDADHAAIAQALLEPFGVA